jgi:hypothetical protein
MAGLDVHQHLWPPSFVEELSRRASIPCLKGATLHLSEGVYEIELGDHELATRLSLLDRAGIDTAVVSLQPTLGLESVEAAERERLERVWEEGILELAAAAAGRIVPLAPGLPRAGFAGSSIGADLLDDLDALAPTLDALRGSGVLFVHPVAGDPPKRIGQPGVPTRLVTQYEEVLVDARGLSARDAPSIEQRGRAGMGTRGRRRRRRRDPAADRDPPGRTRPRADPRRCRRWCPDRGRGRRR